MAFEPQMVSQLYLSPLSRSFSRSSGERSTFDRFPIVLHVLNRQKPQLFHYQGNGTKLFLDQAH